jgi:NAD(P) transhydrogenase subunit alpha
MKIAVAREIAPGETRVAAVPETVKGYVRQDIEVLVEAGAGASAHISDDAYRQAGASVIDDVAELLGQADLVLKVARPLSVEGRDEPSMLRSGSALVAMLSPSTQGPLAQQLAEANVTSFALEMIPRITRAQSMDVLSSMSTLAGYKAVLAAANALGRLLPMMMTAAGTIRPASALVIGAGVAGLQAVATARRLGAVVKAVDTRPAVKEQVESLGAKFIPLEVDHEAEDAGGYARDLGEDFYKQEQDVLAEHVAAAHMIITTALIPGRPAPKLITGEMVESMTPGSAIVDLAAVAGGNCSLTEAGQRVEHAGVTILGPENLPAEMPVHASWMFSRNVANFLGELIQEGQLNVDTENEVIKGTLVTHEGQVVHELARKALETGGPSQ